MNYGFLKELRRLNSIFVISRTKNMNMEKCYFRHIQEEDKVDITLLVKVKDSLRQFNFSRKPTENLQTLFGRMGTNVQKVINKINKKKKVSEVTEVSIEMLTEKDDPIPGESTCMDLFNLSGPLKLKIEDQIYEAVFNAPWVVNINLPQSIMAGFPIYPEQYQTLYSDQDNTTFNWFTGVSFNDSGNAVSDIHIKWELVGSGFIYTPTSQDIGKKLKLECIPGNKRTKGPAVEVISKQVIEAGPGRCPFEARHMFTTDKLKGKSFRCVTYNILADLYCDSDFTRTTLHPYCPPYALHIDYRKQLILKELTGYNADIICLQEVDRKIFNHCLRPFLGASGLDGKFYRKGKEVAEGLSCFFRRDRFEFIKDESILLSKAVKSKEYLKPIWDSIKVNTQLCERVLDRSTVASATVLKSVDNPNELVIAANTHLYFHPDSDHIRLLQGGMVIYWLRHFKNELIKKFDKMGPWTGYSHPVTSLAYSTEPISSLTFFIDKQWDGDRLRRIRQLCHKNPYKKVSLILCGDFNSVPSCGVYQLFTTGKAPSTLSDWSSNTEEAVKNLSLEQDIPLDSACGTPPFTNFTAGFADCLDYIFYEKTALQVQQVVPFPSTEELQAHTALPSIVFPSDHIALISDLCFK